MSLTWIKNIFNSVFTKLLLLTCATVLVINISVVSLFWIYKAVIAQPFRQNIAQYLDYIVADLGAQPTQDKALEITYKTALEIHYLGPNKPWSTSNTPQIEPFHLLKAKHMPNMQFGGHNKSFVVKYTLPSGDYIFEFTDKFEDDFSEGIVHTLFFIILTTILTITYFLTKRLLRPILLLTKGVEQVSNGNLSHTIPVKTKDELGELASSFNAMTSKLRGIIHTKERLLTDVSHELRSPLTRMKVALEFLPEENRKDLKEDILEMEMMITSILETARKHHTHTNTNLQQIDISQVVSSITKQYFDATPQVIYESPNKPIICRVDQDQIRSTIQNIIENGIKYSHKTSDPIQVITSKHEDEVKITISDNGIGIRDEELPFITEPFYRVDASRSKETGGYGLGLSLCKTIMDTHNGTIKISSIEGQGTTVLLTIPMKS